MRFLVEIVYPLRTEPKFVKYEKGVSCFTFQVSPVWVMKQFNLDGAVSIFGKNRLDLRQVVGFLSVGGNDNQSYRCWQFWH